MSKLNAVLVAVSDPTRRAILDHLMKGPARVTDLAAPLPMSFAAVSKHVIVLEHVGLVKRTKRGREHTIELDPRPLREVARWASHYEKYWTARLDRLEDFFKAKGKRS